jgi:hypothetical protein
MLKNIPVAVKVAVGAVLVVSTIVFVTYQNQRAANKYQRICQEQISKVSPGAGEKDTASAKECDDPKDYMPWWYKLVAWPEGIGGWALIATGFVIAWQSYETRKTANASADAANAAYGSVTFAKAQWELMKEKERARLDIQGGTASVEKSDQFWHLGGTLRGRNIGQSRAFIIQSFSKLTVKLADAAYPEYESYGQVPFEDSFVDPDPTNAFAILGFTFFPENEDKIRFLAEDLHASRRSLHLYGFVDYETLGMRFRKEFGFVWKVIDPAWYIGGMVGEGQEPPTDAQKVTFGYWSVDLERSKPEYPISREQAT